MALSGGYLVQVALFIEICWAGWPVVKDMLPGLIPHVTDKNLYVAIGILGATVMPHNLYLHSALVQTRRIGKTEADKRTACRYNLIDSTIALNGALFVNAGILVLAVAVFFKRGIVVTEIQQANQLLSPLLGTTSQACSSRWRFCARASPPRSPAPWPGRSSWKASSTSACGPGCGG